MKVNVKCPNCGSGNNWILYRKDVNLLDDKSYEALRKQAIKDWGENAAIAKILYHDCAIFEHKCGNCEKHFFSRHMLKVEATESAVDMDLSTFYNETEK